MSFKKGMGFGYRVLHQSGHPMGNGSITSTTRAAITIFSASIPMAAAWKMSLETGHRMNLCRQPNKNLTNPNNPEAQKSAAGKPIAGWQNGRFPPELGVEGRVGSHLGWLKPAG